MANRRNRGYWAMLVADGDDESWTLYFCAHFGIIRRVTGVWFVQSTLADGQVKCLIAVRAEKTIIPMMMMMAIVNVIQITRETHHGITWQLNPGARQYIPNTFALCVCRSCGSLSFCVCDYDWRIGVRLYVFGTLCHLYLCTCITFKLNGIVPIGRFIYNNDSNGMLACGRTHVRTKCVRIELQLLCCYLWANRPITFSYRQRIPHWFNRNYLINFVLLFVHYWLWWWHCYCMFCRYKYLRQTQFGWTMKTIRKTYNRQYHPVRHRVAICHSKFSIKNAIDKMLLTTFMRTMLITNSHLYLYE